MRRWPVSVEELVEEQAALGADAPALWKPEPGFDDIKPADLKDLMPPDDGPKGAKKRPEEDD